MRDEKTVTETIERQANVPYIVYEGTVARHERTVKRLVIALIVSIVMIFCSNLMWLHFVQQYDFETYEYTQDGQGVNVVGDGNGVDYDESKTGNPETPTEEPEES